jgi:hypothetical protein
MDANQTTNVNTRGVLRCDICFRIFKTHSGYIRHQKRATCTIKGKRECKTCGGYFATSGWRRHEKGYCLMNPGQPPPNEELGKKVKALEEKIRAIEEAGKLERQLPLSGTEIEETVTTTRKVRFTNAEAGAWLRYLEVLPRGDPRANNVTPYVISEMLERVTLPTTGMPKRERENRTAEVLQETTATMMDTYKDQRNVLPAEEKKDDFHCIFARKNAEQIPNDPQERVMTQTITLHEFMETLMDDTCNQVVIMLDAAKDTKAPAEAIKATYKNGRRRIVEISKPRFRRLLEEMAQGSEETLNKMPWWRDREERQKKTAGEGEVVYTKM